MENYLKKILMISYYYPPIADVGSLRALGFSKYLSSFGWETYVLSIKNPDKSYILIPRHKDEQDTISKPLSNINKYMFGKIAKLQKLKRLKKSLMQNLLNGTVPVTVD